MPDSVDSLRRWRGLGYVFFVCLMVLAVQWEAGAYGSDIGAYPDEPAHFVSAMVVRDYIAQGFPGSPLAYAQAYYDHYPKVAIGNWPPGFYLMQTPLLLILPAHPKTSLLVVALLGVLAVVLLVRSLRGHGRSAALLAPLFLLFHPLFRNSAAQVMTEVPVMALVFAAALQWARVMTTGQLRDGALFGVLAAAAIMTKGSALALALLPLFAVAIGRRFHVMRRPAFWLPVAVVVPICGPWYWFTRNIAREGWLSAELSGSFISSALTYYPTSLLQATGWLGSALAVVGIVSAFRERSSGNGDLGHSLVATQAGLLLAVLSFHAIVPAGLETRHLVTLLPSLAFFQALAAQRWWSAAAVGVTRLRYQRAIVTVVAGTALLSLAASPVRKSVKGYSEAADFVLESGADISLISSDASGEGAYIAELAARDSERPGHRTIRSSQLFAEMNWSGRTYQARARTEEEAKAAIVNSRAQVIVEDRSIPENLLVPHHTLLNATVAGDKSTFRLLFRTDVMRDGVLYPGALSVYAAEPGSVADLRS